MKFTITVKTKSHKEQVEQISSDNLVVSVRASAVEGQANKALVNLLSEYFDVARSRICIVSGSTSRKKIIEIV